MAFLIAGGIEALIMRLQLAQPGMTLLSPEAWITHAQSLKPGSPMPDLPQFRGSDLRALVAYLQTLK